MLTTVHHEISPWDAHIVRGLLASEGIPAVLFGEHYITVNWWQSLALGQVRVQVPNAYVAEAHRVLSERQHGDFARVLESQWDLPPDLCPKCGAWDWQPRRSRVFALLLVTLTLVWRVNLQFPPPSVGQRCSRCGHFEPISSEGKT